MNRYRISELKIQLNETPDVLPFKIAKKLRIPENSIQDLVLVRESIDARKKNDIKKVYTVDFSVNKKLKLEKAPDRTYQFPKRRLPMNAKIVIVGFGPCGMFCGLLLAQMGYKPVIIERGCDVETRTNDVETFWKDGILKKNSNVQFGEGGAGAFSDGKLTTGINDPRIYKVLTSLHAFGAPEDILYKQKPHIGTDVLKNVVKTLREEIIRLGGQVLFSHQLTGIHYANDQLQGIDVQTDNGVEEWPCDKLVLAMGHSARDTFTMLHDVGLRMEQKRFSIGTRIEHPQTLIDESQYGDAAIASILGPAEYKLNARTKSGRGVYTFCMCPGGEVILASSDEGLVLSNGMSYHARDLEFANSGLLVDVYTEDFESEHPLAGMYFQERYERKAYERMQKYALPETTVQDFKTSVLAECLPPFAVDAICEALPMMGKKLKGFDAPNAKLKGPETRSSSPVRMPRDEQFESNIKGVYPGGEGAGFAGGIMSAAVDGIKIAEHIVMRD